MNCEKRPIFAEQESKIMHIAGDVVDVALPQRGFYHVIEPFPDSTTLEAAEPYVVFESF
jgi:hypothetical protein